MKTKEFIKMLQEEDPSGESYLRINGCITSVCSKPGYWDGPYSYLEQGDDGKPIWVESTRGNKIDVYCMDLFDFSEKFKGNWDEMKKHIKVEYDYLDNGERERSFLENAKKDCDEYKEMIDSLHKNSHIEMIENAKKGWKWFQNKDVDKNEKPNLHKYYAWKIYDEKGKEQSSNVHHTESIMNSGDWEKLDSNQKEGYYEWIYKNN